MKSYIVDSFTTEAFKGNPAAVCFPEGTMSEEKMLLIAREFNLSETAFVWPLTADTYQIRYFSPMQEIPLCGHATLAAARIIFQTNTEPVIHFITAENIDLPVSQKGNDITMSFPVYDTVTATVPPAMLDALGLTAVSDIVFSKKNKIIVLLIEDPEILKNMRPDFTALLGTHSGLSGVLVTAPSNSTAYDFHYRYFWPWSGGNEDPVTGGVQTFLAKYWSDKLRKKELSAFQSSARTGFMKILLQDDKVLVTGQAVIIMEGDMLINER